MLVLAEFVHSSCCLFQTGPADSSEKRDQISEQSRNGTGLPSLLVEQVSPLLPNADPCYISILLTAQEFAAQLKLFFADLEHAGPPTHYGMILLRDGANGKSLSGL
jgi:hypothetical protein